MEGDAKSSGLRGPLMSAARLEETAAFPFIEVSGTPRNVGLQYGRKAAGRIHRSIEIYRRTFAEKGVEWTLARAAAARFALRAASTGQVSIRTTPLLTPDEVDKALQRTVDYRAPGQAS